MKKITLFSLILLSINALAQFNTIETNPVQSGPMPNWKPNYDINARNVKALQSGVFHYELNWQYAKTEYEKGVNNAPVGDFTYYGNVLFMDSTAKYSNSSSTANVFNVRAGVIVDPKSPYYSPGPAFDEVPFLKPTDAYQVDSILIVGFYQRRTSVNDTLLLEISWADTSNTSVWQTVLSSISPRTWLTPFVNSSTSHGNVSHLTCPSTNRLFLKKVLTPADTITVNNPYRNVHVFVMPAGGLKIPANNILAVTYSFIPGTDYTSGDVVYQYTNPVNAATKNGFAGSLRGGKTNAAYLYDKSTQATNPAKTKNSGVDYYHVGRYGKYTGAGAYLNSCMRPSADFAWNVSVIISNQPVGIDENQANNIRVGQNVPNPFNDNTYISYELVEGANVTLEIFDVTGKKVQTINEGRKFAGSHNIQFNGGNLQAGVYFYTLTAGETRVTKRMTLVK